MRKENSFDKRLKKLAIDSFKSVNQIERELGYPRNSLHNYKEGREPSGDRLLDLSLYFGVTPEYLMGRDRKGDNHVVSPSCFFDRLSEEQKLEMVSLCQKWLQTKIVRLGEKKDFI